MNNTLTKNFKKHFSEKCKKKQLLFQNFMVETLLTEHKINTPSDDETNKSFNKTFDSELLKVYSEMLVANSPELKEAIQMLDLKTLRSLKEPLERIKTGTYERLLPDYAEFDKIILELDETNLQLLLEKIDIIEFEHALLVSPEEVYEKVLFNTSEETSNMIAEDIEFCGPVLKKQCLECKHKILQTIQNLEEIEEIKIDENLTGEENE